MRCFGKLNGCREKHGGFTLVEVVLAVGIAAFALTSIVGVFGVLITRGGDNAERSTLQDAVNSLGTHLNEQEDFATVYGWAAATAGRELLGVTYHADADGDPDAASDLVRSVWFLRGATPKNDAGTALTVQNIDIARAGRWISANVSLSGNNPVEPLSGSVNAYPHAYVVLTVKMNAIETPDVTLTADDRGKRTRLEVPIVVLR